MHWSRKQTSGNRRLFCPFQDHASWSAPPTTHFRRGCAATLWCRRTSLIPLFLSVYTSLGFLLFFFTRTQLSFHCVVRERSVLKWRNQTAIMDVSCGRVPLPSFPCWCFLRKWDVEHEKILTNMRFTKPAARVFSSLELSPPLRLVKQYYTTRHHHRHRYTRGPRLSLHRDEEKKKDSHSRFVKLILKRLLFCVCGTYCVSSVQETAVS